MRGDAAKQSCKGTYRKVYVLEVPYWKAWEHALGKSTPLARESKDVYRVRDLGAHSVGKTERCAYAKAVKAAEQLAREINAAGDAAEAEPADVIGQCVTALLRP